MILPLEHICDNQYRAVTTTEFLLTFAILFVFTVGERGDVISFYSGESSVLPSKAL
jgi:hypothetical protein